MDLLKFFLLTSLSSVCMKFLWFSRFFSFWNLVGINWTYYFEDMLLLIKLLKAKLLTRLVKNLFSFFLIKLFIILLLCSEHCCWFFINSFFVTIYDHVSINVLSSLNKCANVFTMFTCFPGKYFTINALRFDYMFVFPVDRSSLPESSSFYQTPRRDFHSKSIFKHDSFRKVPSTCFLD